MLHLVPHDLLNHRAFAKYASNAGIATNRTTYVDMTAQQRHIMLTYIYEKHTLKSWDEASRCREVGWLVWYIPDIVAQLEQVTEYNKNQLGMGQKEAMDAAEREVIKSVIMANPHLGQDYKTYMTRSAAFGKFVYDSL